MASIANLRGKRAAANPASRRSNKNDKRTLEDVFHDRLEEIRTELDYETIPIWKLVAVQARAGLICLDHRNGISRSVAV